jgi:hypothetical protein
MAQNMKPAAALIRHTPLQGDDEGIDLRRLIPAWIISGVIHVVLLSILLLFTIGDTFGSIGSENAVVESQVDEKDTKDANLENDEIGNDPDLPTNYNIDRIEEMSVPGPLNPNEQVGILNAPDNLPPQTLPPPPGFGDARGQGGGNESDKVGQGGMFGFAGGMGGPKMQPGSFHGRSGATREKSLREGGGNARSEAAVASGLKWLVRHQALDGHWGLHDFNVHGKCNCGNPGGQYDVAGTSFGLLPLLGAGETHKGTGRNHMYAKNVERALKWIITRQGADGQFSGNGYEHGMCTICICEAYGLTADPILKGPAQRAINATVAWQHTAGGFRYSPRIPGDMSVHGWMVQALKSGAMAGLNVPNATWNGVNNFLDQCSIPEGSGYGYQQPQPAPTVTAVGLLCRQYMGWGPRNVGLQKGLEYLRKLPPSPNFKNIYYYYYATQVVHHMQPFNPEAWDQWNPKMRDMLIESQDQGLNGDKRDQKGSWSPEGDAWGGQIGRLGYTSFALLTLEVYYRHLPLYRRELGAMKDEAIKDAVK